MATKSLVFADTTRSVIACVRGCLPKGIPLVVVRPLQAFALVTLLCCETRVSCASKEVTSAALDIEIAFTATVLVGQPVVIDHVPDGVRRYIPIIGGTFEGPKIKGKVLAVGGDSQIVRSDGTIVLEARYILQTNDNVLISVTNRGLRRAPPAVMEKLSRGEHVSPGEYYFRTVANFEAPVGSAYDYLNQSLYVATAEREPAAAVVHFYRIK